MKHFNPEDENFKFDLSRVKIEPGKRNLFYISDPCFIGITAVKYLKLYFIVKGIRP